MIDSTTRHSVLCVESSEATHRILQGALCAYDCAFASNAQDAIQHMQGKAFDAYVLDYWMPDWSGPLLCREIRKRDPYCPVIMCGDTASISRHNRGGGVRASAYVARDDVNALASTLLTLLALSDLDSERAEQDASRVLSSQFDRCVGVLARTRKGTATNDDLERAVRGPTFRSYIDGGGTRAHFERWWPQRFRNERLAKAA